MSLLFYVLHLILHIYLAFRSYFTTLFCVRLKLFIRPLFIEHLLHPHYRNIVTCCAGCRLSLRHQQTDDKYRCKLLSSFFSKKDSLAYSMLVICQFARRLWRRPLKFSMMIKVFSRILVGFGS